MVTVVGKVEKPEKGSRDQAPRSGQEVGKGRKQESMWGQQGQGEKAFLVGVIIWVEYVSGESGR